MVMRAMGELHLLLLLVVGLWQLPSATAQTPTQTPTRAPTAQWLPLGTYPQAPFNEAYISSTTPPLYPYGLQPSNINLAK